MLTQSVYSLITPASAGNFVFVLAILGSILWLLLYSLVQKRKLETGSAHGRSSIIIIFGVLALLVCFRPLIYLYALFTNQITLESFPSTVSQSLAVCAQFEIVFPFTTIIYEILQQRQVTLWVVRSIYVFTLVGGSLVIIAWLLLPIVPSGG
jgi:hypothetical protein